MNRRQLLGENSMDTVRSGTTEETGVSVDLNGILTRISDPNNWTDAFFEEVNKCYSEHFNQIRLSLIHI